MDSFEIEHVVPTRAEGEWRGLVIKVMVPGCIRQHDKDRRAKCLDLLGDCSPNTLDPSFENAPKIEIWLQWFVDFDENNPLMSSALLHGRVEQLTQSNTKRA